MADSYLVTHDRILGRSMDFYFRPLDGALLVDEEGRDIPFTVEPEAVYALLTYLGERKERILEAQKQVIQNAIDIQDQYPGTDVSPRFELVLLEDEEE